MPRRYRKLGSGLATRVEHLEARLRIEESWQERQGRELLARWLASGDAAIDAYVDVEAEHEAHGSPDMSLHTEASRAARVAMLASAEGRAAIEAMTASLFQDVPEP